MAQHWHSMVFLSLYIIRILSSKEMATSEQSNLDLQKTPISETSGREYRWEYTWYVMSNEFDIAFHVRTS